MENYLYINGKKIILTPEQLSTLGITPAPTLSSLRDALRDGTYPDTFQVGDVIEDFGYRFQIIGFNHDQHAEDSSNTPFDQMRETATVMAMELLPPHRMHDGKCKSWAESELRAWLNDDILHSLPDELQELIQPTKRLSVDHDGNAQETVDRLFLPTESELFGSAIYSPAECGERYPVFAASANRVRYDDDGDPDWYWTSSANTGNSTYFVGVNGTGYVYYNNASNAHRAPFCFQIS